MSQARGTLHALLLGRYQAEFQRRGVTIHTPDVLLAGTARVHGAIILTDNIADFPMRDVRSERPMGD
ncbi:MAG TPA: hypothetical protein VEQ37_08695 [Actinomycetota bacterium]|nr:hypothetical protein [Actinomycetota bacterium]